jgi:hypothetical protein
VGALAMVCARLCLANAEGDQVVATIDQPAVVTAVAAPSVQARPADQPARVIIKITGYQPPPNGAVLAVAFAFLRDIDYGRQENTEYRVFINRDY